MAGQNLAVKLVVTPLLIGGARLAGRRYGHHVGGWLVGLPLTSGPVAFCLATEQGMSFAAGAAVGMLAGTISQVAFALAYRSELDDAGRCALRQRAARRGTTRVSFAGCGAFAVATITLSFLHWTALETFALVLAALIVGYAATARRASGWLAEPTRPPRWDIPVRMLAATAVVVLITALAPVLGAHLAGLLSPFPVFGAVLAIFNHHSDGPAGGIQVLDGLLLGLLAPAVFFLVLALTLPILGLLAFAIATAAALTAQGITMLAIPSDQQPAAS